VLTPILEDRLDRLAITFADLTELHPRSQQVVQILTGEEGFQPSAWAAPQHGASLVPFVTSR
jgi:hypothetical protein